MRRLRTSLAAAAVAVALALAATAAVSGRHHAALAATPETVGPLPVVFEPNVGQWNGRVRFAAHTGGSTLYVTGSQLMLALRRGAERDVVSLRFVGAQASRVSATSRASGHGNYLLGPDPRRWHTHVPQFGGVRYAQLYPGVDLDVHASRAAGFEYDFRLAPGADPGRLRLALAGARSVRVAADGTLVLHLPHGDVRQPRPHAWQTVAGAPRPVAVGYRLEGNTVRFRVGAYDHARQLVIDPKVVYASYWGGRGPEGCGPIPGPHQAMYVLCGTGSDDLRVVGEIQQTGGAEDVYVAKLDRTGTRIVYATYLGGPGFDEGDYAVVDDAGHLYVAGFAGPSFPTTPGAYDTSFNGDGACCGGFFGDAFVAKLSRDGSRLEYSTYVGGSNGERADVLALGDDGRVAITGFTGSADFPTTPGALVPDFRGGTGTFEGMPIDAYAAVLDRSGSRLVYSTYLGGTEDDNGYDVALDDAGNAYYTGVTRSADFPTSPGALQTSLAGGQDAYALKLDRRGRLVWSTFLGGAERDRGGGIGVDRRRDVYLSGTTRGDFPVTAGAPQMTFGGVRDLFVAKLARDGRSLEWSTYLGGSDADGEIDATMRLDRHANVDVVAMTASTDFPTTPDAFQGANAGVVDIAIAQLDRNGRLRFASYFGGSGVDDTSGAFPAVDDRGNLYVAGVTNSPDLPVTPDAIQPSFGGGDIDGILVKVAFGRDDDD